MITYSPCVSRSLLIEWTHMLDEDIGQPDWILLITTIMQIFHCIFLTFILNLQFRSNNNHSSHAWKRWKWTTSLSCFTFCRTHARAEPMWTPQILTRACVVARTHALSLPVRTHPCSPKIKYLHWFLKKFKKMQINPIYFSLFIKRKKSYSLCIEIY